LQPRPRLGPLLLTGAAHAAAARLTSHHPMSCSARPFDDASQAQLPRRALSKQQRRRLQPAYRASNTLSQQPPQMSS